MPEPTQIPPAPITKLPAVPVSTPSVAPVTKPQPAATMQTSVQLTFSFEIAAMQLTPSFKMGSLNVRPISQGRHDASGRLSATATGNEFASKFRDRKDSAARKRPWHNSDVSVPTKATCGRFTLSCSHGPATRIEFRNCASPTHAVPTGAGHCLCDSPVPITTIEFAPSLEIASVVLNSNSSRFVCSYRAPGLVRAKERLRSKLRICSSLIAATSP
jgi:hypothetical protein